RTMGGAAVDPAPVIAPGRWQAPTAEVRLMDTPRTTSAAVSPPLEGDWVECPLTIEVEGRQVTGLVRANWGAVHVTITSAIAGLARGWDGRGMCFAMACHHRPEYRYALAGVLTERGRQRAGQFLAGLYLDWLAVSRHEAEVDAACRGVRRELAELER